MNNYIKFFLCILISIFLATSCTNKKEIESEINGIKRQIQLIDNEIHLLEQEKAKLATFGSDTGEMIVRTKVEPEIYQYERARELLLIKLESLYQKL